MKFGYYLKQTTPVHWLYGAGCVYIILQFGLLWGWVGMAALAVLEHWNDKEEAKKKPHYVCRGCTDLWEAFVLFAPGNLVLAILHHLAIVTIVLSV